MGEQHQFMRWQQHSLCTVFVYGNSSETHNTYSRRFMQNWYEKTLGAAKVLTGYLGNLMVTITTDMKISLAHAKFLWIMQQRRPQQQHLTILRSLAKLARMKTCLEKPKLLGSFWQSRGYQQNQYEKTFGDTTVLTGYFGNFIAPITTDMNISLDRSEFLWIISAIFRSPAKLVRKDAWNNQSSLDYSGNLAVTNKTGMKRPWEQPKFV